MVPITVHAAVVGVIERIHDPMFNQRSDAVFAEFIAEGLRVVVTGLIIPQASSNLRSCDQRPQTTNAKTAASIWT